jgi:hypothetical protein
MSRLFKKSFKITTWAAPAPGSFVGANANYFETIGNGLEIVPPLNVEFEIKKTLGKTPNTAKITIYNLAPTTRAELERKPRRMQFAAGYDGIAELLFDGDVRTVYTDSDGPDQKTVVELGDGARAHAHAFITKSYKNKVRVEQVIKDCAASMGLDLPPEVEQSVDLRQALSAGINLHGPTRDVLTRILAPYGYSWSTQNGQLVILRDDQVREGEAILLNQDTGLLDSPKRKDPAKPGKKPPEVTCASLLFPADHPGPRGAARVARHRGRLQVPRGDA